MNDKALFFWLNFAIWLLGIGGFLQAVGALGTLILLFTKD